MGMSLAVINSGPRIYFRNGQYFEMLTHHVHTLAVTFVHEYWLHALYVCIVVLWHAMWSVKYYCCNQLDMGKSRFICTIM